MSPRKEPPVQDLRSEMRKARERLVDASSSVPRGDQPSGLTQPSEEKQFTTIRPEQLVFTGSPRTIGIFMTMHEAMKSPTKSMTFERLMEFCYGCSVMAPIPATQELDPGEGEGAGYRLFIEEMASLRRTMQGVLDLAATAEKKVAKDAKKGKTSAKKQPSEKATDDMKAVVEVWKKTFGLDPKHIHWGILVKHFKHLAASGISYEKMKQMIRVSPQDPFVAQKAREGQPLYPNAILSDKMINQLLALVERSESGASDDAVLEAQRLKAAQRRYLNRVWHLVPMADKLKIRREFEQAQTLSDIEKLASRVKTEAAQSPPDDSPGDPE